MQSVDAVGNIASPPQSVGSMSIAELINSNGNLAVLSTLLSSAGLGSLLGGPGPFTVLAPTNAAFGTYDLNGLLGPANLVKLRKILGNHVLKGAFQQPDQWVGDRHSRRQPPPGLFGERIKAKSPAPTSGPRAQTPSTSVRPAPS